jgi:hypothetical protein
MPRWQTPYQHQVGQQVQVVGHGLAVNAQVAREHRRIQQSAVVVCQHGP